jgi:hypothetical protein
LAIWKQIADGAHSSVSAFYLIHTAVEKGATNHFGIFFQWRNEHFKPSMLLFSVGNGAMKSPTAQCMIRDVGNCVMMPDNQETSTDVQYF